MKNVRCPSAIGVSRDSGSGSDRSLISFVRACPVDLWSISHGIFYYGSKKNVLFLGVWDNC